MLLHVSGRAEARPSGRFGGTATPRWLFPLAIAAVLVEIIAVRTTELKQLAKRPPFRPFGVRLSNGAQYIFNEPRQFGAPADFNMIFFFGKSNAFRIDTENIVVIFEKE